MKMKMNKACDLSSISVFPPQTRRSNAAPTGGPQLSQFRSQASQQSFSQGPSSQHCGFSQLTQNSVEDAFAKDQRFGSQERENSQKKPSCFPHVYSREGSLPLTKSSANLGRRWNSAAGTENKCQISEELEHRIGMIETSLNKSAMMLDSVQSDIMQVSKGTKEISMEAQSIRQKLTLHDTSLELLNKGQADIKDSVDGSLKSLFHQLSKDPYQEKLQKIFDVLSGIPEQMESSLRKLQNELYSTLSREIQAASLKTPHQNGPMHTVIPAKPNVLCTTTQSQKQTNHPKNFCTTTQSQKQPNQHKNISTTTQSQKQPNQPRNISTTTRSQKQPYQAKKTLLIPLKTFKSPKIEVGSWKTVKRGQSTCGKRVACREHKQDKISSTKQEKVCRVIIESDAESDEGFSYFLNGITRDNGSKLIEESKEEAERILLKARRAKRKYSNAIIID